MADGHTLSERPLDAIIPLPIIIHQPNHDPPSSVVDDQHESVKSEAVSSTDEEKTPMVCPNAQLVNIDAIITGIL